MRQSSMIVTPNAPDAGRAYGTGYDSDAAEPCGTTQQASRFASVARARLGERLGASWRHLERAKGFEPSTPTLARLCSTPELHPRSAARSPGKTLAMRRCEALHLPHAKRDCKGLSRYGFAGRLTRAGSLRPGGRAGCSAIRRLAQPKRRKQTQRSNRDPDVFRATDATP